MRAGFLDVAGNDNGDEMKVRVQFYAQLRDLIGMRELEVELRATARPFANCSKRFMRSNLRFVLHDKSILIGAGLEFVDRNYKLNPGRGNRDHAAGARRVRFGGCEGVSTLIAIPRGSACRPATFRIRPARGPCRVSMGKCRDFFRTGDEVQEFARRCAKGHRRCLVEGLSKCSVRPGKEV